MNPLDIARRTLRRVHATREENIPGILVNGLQPRPHHLDPNDANPSVFMTVDNGRLDDTFYMDMPTDRNALIRYRIPKDWHRDNTVLNPHYREMRIGKYPDWDRGYEANALNRRLADYRMGGRAAAYDKPIPNEFIDEICFGPHAEWCYDPQELLRHVEEAPDDEFGYVWGDRFYPRAQDTFDKYGRK